ncbi:MAG: TraR/DksA C4-type zinc finger protein [Motiliproteus sp.]
MTRCILEYLDGFTRRRVDQLAKCLGVSASQVAHSALITADLFDEPERGEVPRFLRVIEGGRMADVADQAQNFESDTLARSLAAVPRYTGESAVDCEGCLSPIPEGRRKAVPGCELCAPCQDKADRKARHGL